MRVLFWCDAFWPLVGGVEVLAARLVTALRERGHELCVVTRREANHRARDVFRGVPVHRLEFHEAMAGRGTAVAGTVLLLVAAVGQPLAGVVFVLDGVLIGAGDGAFLAWAGLVVLAAYAPAAIWAATLPHGLVMVWVAMTVVFMGARGVLLTWRARGDAWLVTGARATR